MRFLSRLFRRAENNNRAPNELLYEAMMEKCPDCGNPAEYYEGPSGGMNVNIFCGHCGQGYNIAPAINWAEKIHRDEKYIVKK